MKRIWGNPFNELTDIIGNLRCMVKGLALFATCVGSPLFADATQHCPPLRIEAVCNAGVAEAITLRPPISNDGSRSFALTSQNLGGITGDQAILLKSGQSVTLPTGNRPISLAIVGLEGDGAASESACCFSNQHIEIADLCAPVDDVPQTQITAETLPDIGITLTMSDTCRDGACTGVATLTGDVQPDTQVSFNTTPAIVRDVQTDSNVTCSSTAGATLCDWQSPPNTNIIFKIPTSQPEGTFEVCAEIGVGAEPKLRAMALQAALNAQGFNVGAVDGLIGPATRAALAQMKSSAGITQDDLLPPAAMTLLGLGDYADANMENNRMCATARIPKPPLVCDTRSTVRRDDTCQCRLRNMVRLNARSCACPKGTVASGGSCVERKEPKAKAPVSKALVCDRNSTVQRGAECACRYQGMRKLSATRCGCKTGLPALPGVGCVSVNLSLPGSKEP